MPNYYGPWGTPNSTYRVWTAVSQSQSTANNQTTVTAVAYFEDRYGYGAWDSNTLLRITIRGSNRGGDRTIKLAGGANTSLNIGTGTYTINHGSDGKLSNTGVSVHVNLRNTGLYSGTASGTLTHPTIPRATTPSSGNFTTGSATTISLPRASSSFTHNVTYKVGATTGTISSSAGTSVSWTPPHSLANRFSTNSTSTTVTITVQTKSGSTVIGTKTMNKTITLGSSVKPNVSSLTISEQNSLVTAAGVTDAYIQNVSKIRVVNNVDNWTTINSSQKASTFSIGTLSANAGSEIIPATSGDTVAISGTVTDQRNRAGTRSQNVKILAYSAPTYTAASRVYRAKTASGAEDSDGTYLRLVLNATARSIVTSSTQRNKLFIAIRTRANGGSWQTRTFSPAPTSNTYNSTFNIPATHVTTKSHEVEVTLTDNFGGKTVVIYNVGTSIPTMDLNGFSVGIGKMHERGALDVGPGGIYSDGVLVQPSGVVSAFAGVSAPNGWLLCQGQEVSRATYSDLYAILGTRYGAGNGTSTFNLPNLQGRLPVGLSSGETEFNTLGKTGGTKTHTLTTAQLPSHNHSASTSSAGAHTHRVTGGANGTTRLYSGGAEPKGAVSAKWHPWFGSGYSGLDNVYAASAGAHTHSVTVNSTGSGSAHNILQPYAVMNYIIKI